MANMFDISSSDQTTDDISIFLRQILFKSSSSSSAFLNQPPYSAGGSVNVAGVHVPSSSSVGTMDYDHLDDEYDCESQEGFENLMEEMGVKPNPPRNSSKRTRAAEVHNMSEKRRRSRINEKLKALQKLIPNSNKTDKASMLDEAIEYLKQLQQQVQMLTLRNGMNLYSMCTPHGVAHPNHIPSSLNQGNQSNMTRMNQERLVSPMTGHPIQCVTRNQPSILDFSHTTNQGSPCGTQLGSS